MKIAFVFSGQGAQYPGMFKDLYEESTEARGIMDEADKALKRKISKLCFEGTQQELNLTHNTQPCVLAADLAAGLTLIGNGIQPDAVAGFSLGEYAALTIAGVLEEKDVFPLIQARADFMQEAVPVNAGAMAAVMGKTGAQVEDLCSEIKDDYVIAANYNSPVQTVVSGTAQGVQKLLHLAQEKEIRAIPLAVSAPFHCRLMKPAAKQLKSYLAQITVKSPKVPVYMNYTAKPLVSQTEVKELLCNQACNPVLWEQTIKNMTADGIDTFIECGPGKTLCGLIKKTVKDVNVYRVENVKTLKETLQKLQEKK